MTDKTVEDFKREHPDVRLTIRPNDAWSGTEIPNGPPNYYAYTVLDLAGIILVPSQDVKASTPEHLVVSWLELELETQPEKFSLAPPWNPKILEVKQYDRKKVTAMLPNELLELEWICTGAKATADE